MGVIHESKYGGDPNNFHVHKRGDELHVTLTYPPWDDASNKGGQCRYVVFDQEAVRASDGIRISYDYDRDGYKIEQATVFAWEVKDEVCDPGWVEVAFIQAWAKAPPDLFD